MDNGVMLAILVAAMTSLVMTIASRKRAQQAKRETRAIVRKRLGI